MASSNEIETVAFPEKHKSIEASSLLVKKTAEFVRQQLEGQGAGHDWYHVERVWSTARHIAEKEGDVDIETVELGAILHDVADYKFHDNDETVGPRVASEWLKSQQVDSAKVEKISDIIAQISFKGAGVETPMSTKEGMIVQDADRLDALGAVGIARAFEYGGYKGRIMYDPTIRPVMHKTGEAYKSSNSPTINHFYEKLFLLKDRMNTNEAKKIAKDRHDYMVAFVKRFFEEWEGLK